MTDRYPEHEKFKRMREQLDLLKRFLAYIQDDEDIELIDSHTGCECAYSDAGREALIFDFAGIDYEAFQKEKDAMVEELRRGQI